MPRKFDNYSYKGQIDNNCGNPRQLQRICTSSKAEKRVYVYEKEGFKPSKGNKEKDTKREGVAKEIASENKYIRKKGCVDSGKKQMNQECMSVTANGVNISTLLDTGGTVTILSAEKVFDSVNRVGKVPLYESFGENHILDGIGVGHQRCESRPRLSAK